MPTSADERRVRLALGDGDPRPFDRPSVELAWAKEACFGIADNLFDMCDPADRARTAKIGVNIAGGSPRTRKMNPD